MKVAFGSVPKDSGTFTFYRNLRPALSTYGIDLRCVTIGQKEAALIEDDFVDDGCVLLAPKTASVRQQSHAFSTWCEQEDVDMVMAINSVAMLSALPHLAPHIRVLSRCANGFDEGYRITLSGLERLMAIVALTPRLEQDLVNKYHTDPNLIHLIPNGIDPTPFQSISRHINTNTTAPIRLGFVGRLEHNQKGVLYLPAIVRELKQLNVSFHLRIAGKGIHRSRLESELRPYLEAGEVTFEGALSKDEIPGFLSEIDVFLFTSHFEGCPNALLEAMMAGCAPVALAIDGITDYIIEHGQSGFIASRGDCKAFAEYIVQLAVDSSLLQRISNAAAARSCHHFTAQTAAERYAQLFQSVMHLPLPDYTPLPWSQFRVDPVYKKRWTSYFPSPVKRLAKQFSSSWVSV